MEILGVCAGQGVMLFPFRKRLIANIECRSVFYTKCNSQWKNNFGSVPMVRSKEQLPEKSLKPDIIIGHPDCGHSSVLAYSRAKKLSNPWENESLNLFITSVNDMQPKLFLMENLAKFLDTVGKHNFENILPNYTLIYHIGSVSMFGNSQKNRKRLVIVGINNTHFKGNINHMVSLFTKIFPVRELKTSGILTKGLEEEDISKGHIRENIDDLITMYAGFKISLREVQTFWANNPTITRWPVKDKKFTTAPAVYRNRYDDYPNTARGANRQYNHEGLQMSPRELARIQGVPNRFKVFIDPKRKGYWINKGRVAVTKTPPYEVSLWFKTLIKKAGLYNTQNLDKRIV